MYSSHTFQVLKHHILELCLLNLLDPGLQDPVSEDVAPKEEHHLEHEDGVWVWLIKDSRCRSFTGWSGILLVLNRFDPVKIIHTWVVVVGAYSSVCMFIVYVEKMGILSIMMVKLHAIHPPIKVLICLEKQVPQYTNCIKWLVVLPGLSVCPVSGLLWSTVSILMRVSTGLQVSKWILAPLGWYQHSMFEHPCYINPKSTVLIENLMVHRNTTAFPLGSVWLPQYSLWHRIIYTITDLHPGYTKFKHPNLTFIDWLLCIPSIVLRILRMICVWLLPQDQEVGSIKSKDRRMKMIEHVQIDWILTAEGLQVNEKPRWDARV